MLPKRLSRMAGENYGFVEGTSPLLISSPHSGILVPSEIAPKLTKIGCAVVDTDWQVDRLYAPLAKQLGASLISARMTRYAADLNRGADNRSLYSERKVSSVVATESFDGDALYLDGQEPDAVEVARRIETYWQPYHNRLKTALAVILARHGYALLWDAHSIRAQVSALAVQSFPALSIGTGGGVSCVPRLQEAVHAVARQQDRYSVVLNGFFKGGYITQHYGVPDSRVSAIQLELHQDAYLDPVLENALSDDSAAAIRDVILRMVTTYCDRAAEAWA